MPSNAMSWLPFGLALGSPLSCYTQGGVHITELVNKTMVTITATTITPIITASLLFMFYPSNISNAFVLVATCCWDL